MLLFLFLVYSYRKFNKIFTILSRLRQIIFKKMLIDYLKSEIISQFGLKPTPQQHEVMHALADFLLSPVDGQNAMKPVFILRGFAGTGKTSLVSALVRTMAQIERKCVLMAPTGRAAKVFAHYSGFTAFTIHKRIYKFDFDARGGQHYTIDFNKMKDTLFIVDEASMIDSDSGLLQDLLSYVFSGVGCRLILMGDTAQLPPVGNSESPALMDSCLENMGVDVMSYTMTDVIRQSQESGILLNATYIRSLVTGDNIMSYGGYESVGGLPKVHFCKDTVNLPGNELVETISDSYDRFGIEQTTIVCRSNKRANIYNQGIRAQILDYEEELEAGDILMIAKNNYYWLDRNYPSSPLQQPQAGEGPLPTSFLANGDVAVVRRVHNEHELYGFRFAECDMELPDYDNLPLTAIVLLDTLHAEAPSLTDEQSEALFSKVMEDYADITTKKERLQKVKEDAHFNALQIKYAYAVTCHKAQGGQWKNVFIDQGYVAPEMIGKEYYLWLYTAFTRATRKVYLVNWKESK